jgi:hypothetical protein
MKTLLQYWFDHHIGVSNVKPTRIEPEALRCEARVYPPYLWHDQVIDTIARNLK